MSGRALFRSVQLLTLFACVSACTPLISKELPSTTDMKPPRDFKLARSIMHLHSIFSGDACDQGKPNPLSPEACVQDLKTALCTNRIDFAFLTDHPSNMDANEFSDLLLPGVGDTIHTVDGNPVMNTLAECVDKKGKHTSHLTVGFEAQIMPLAMKKHIENTDAESRHAFYTETGTKDEKGNRRIEDAAKNVHKIQQQTGGIVVVPHTESWLVDDLKKLGMDGIEIYNFHANMDPKIRPTLGFVDAEASFKIIPYWIDIYGQEQPDLAFVSLFQRAPAYANIWDQLLGSGLKVFGVAGSDAHENIFPQKARDGERLDSYRRILRWMSNHFLVTEMTWDGIRDAVKKGRGWVVFEGLGSPDGMDFYAETTAGIVDMGSSGTYLPGATKIHVSLPSLNEMSPQKTVFNLEPIVKIYLYRIETQGDSKGVKTLVKQTQDDDLSFDVTAPGVYRAEVTIVPKHLRWYILRDAPKTSEETPWIITNPIYLE